MRHTRRGLTAWLTAAAGGSLIGACRLGWPDANPHSRGGMPAAPRGAAPVRLAVPNAGPGGERALESWKAAAAKLREGGAAAVTVEPRDLRAPDAMALEPEGRAPAMAQLLAADPPLDAFVWPSGLPWERSALIRLGLIEPLDRLLRTPERRGGPLDAYHPGALEALRDGGRVVGLPLEMTPTLLLADFRLLAEAPNPARALLAGDAARPGQPAPAGLARWTWEAFEATVARLTRPVDAGGGAGSAGAGARWGFAPTTSLPLAVLLWQHGAEMDGGQGAEPGEPSQPGGPSVRIDPGAARAALMLYARVLRAALGPAAALPPGERLEQRVSITWSRDWLRLGNDSVAMSVRDGIPRNWLANAPSTGGPGASTPPVGFAPLPRLPNRVGRGDPAATRLRLHSFAAVSARSTQPSEAALALHGLTGLVDADAVTLPGRRPPDSRDPLPHLAQLAPIERTALLEGLAHGQAYPTRGEATLEAYLAGRVAGLLQRAPASAGALEEALAAVLQLAA